MSAMCVICEHNSYYTSSNVTCMRKYEGRNGNNASVCYYERLDFVFKQTLMLLCSVHILFAQFQGLHIATMSDVCTSSHFEFMVDVLCFHS